MNPHDHDPELDPTLRSALDQHARSGGRAVGDINDVWARVEHRRRRRRSVAVFGSLAIVGVGVVGIAALAASGDDDGRQMAAGGVDSTIVASATVQPGFNVWSCTGPIGSGEFGDLYESCVPVTHPLAGPMSEMVCVSIPPPTTELPATIPTSTVPPATTVPALAVTVPVTTVFDTVAPAFTEQCSPVGSYAPATTSAATSETTYVAIDTAPPATSFVDGTIPTRGTAPPVVSGDYYPLEQTYVVAAGDSLMLIAQIHAITPEALVNYNGFTDGIGHVIFVGDVIKIPPGALVP